MTAATPAPDAPTPRSDVLPLTHRSTALRDALDAGRHVLPPALRARGDQLADQVRDRFRLPDHTVVALAGPTGAGKSSLVNALTGSDAALVDVTRPTTRETVAVVRGDGAAPLLDWLDVRRRHQLDTAGPGLVLLDLPDHDSVEIGHRLEVERLVGLVDLVIWVLDPQKYADATVHEHHLRHLTDHQDVLTVVLNQADRLTPTELRACTTDLTTVLAHDGLDRVPVLAVSARTGEGVDALREAVDAAAARRTAAIDRLTADVVSLAHEVLQHCEPPPTRDATPRNGTHDDRHLVTALGDAAGVPLVQRAAHDASARAARRRTG
ncbi:ABC transporter, partial [Cellulomonas bogoriensis 69B4 = DSM 16987]